MRSHSPHRAHCIRIFVPRNLHVQSQRESKMDREARREHSRSRRKPNCTWERRLAARSTVAVPVQRQPLGL
jgi:hypothetical protein